MNNIWISHLTITIGLFIMGIVLTFKGSHELYYVVRYRDFGFNTDTYICITIIGFGVLSILMSLSIGLII